MKFRELIVLLNLVPSLIDHLHNSAVEDIKRCGVTLLPTLLEEYPDDVTVDLRLLSILNYYLSSFHCHNLHQIVFGLSAIATRCSNYQDLIDSNLIPSLLKACPGPYGKPLNSTLGYNICRHLISVALDRQDFRFIDYLIEVGVFIRLSGDLQPMGRNTLLLQTLKAIVRADYRYHSVFLKMEFDEKYRKEIYTNLLSMT